MVSKYTWHTYHKKLNGFIVILCVALLHCFTNCSTVTGQGTQTQNKFEDLGIPVPLAALMSATTGPDATGQKELIYLSCAQTASNLLLLAVDPDSGKTQTYESNVAPGAWGITRGADNKIYLGTWNGAHLLQFDPKKPELGVQNLGRPAPSESSIWMLITGQDGKIYGCTSPNAKLFSYDPQTQQAKDLGRLDETQQYARFLACGPNGKLYAGIGYAGSNVVVFDPKTGKRKSILPERYRKETKADVYRLKDGNIYIKSGNEWLRVNDESIEPITIKQLPAFPPLALQDGRTVNTGQLPTVARTLTITNPQSKTVKRLTLEYDGSGVLLFTIGIGPDKKVYGSSLVPLQLFSYDSKTHKTQVLGNPVPIDGQLYSLLPFEDRLYVCAYEFNGYISVYKPDLPFEFGKTPQSNPRGLGSIGEGHLRPRAMILGPNRKIYIGSLPPYGELGGAMAVFDPDTDKIVANYRDIVPQQGVMSLAYEPRSQLVFGGSNIEGGSGAKALTNEAHFFAWDAAKNEKIIDLVVVAGDKSIPAMTTAQGKVFAVSAPSNTLFVYDPQTRKIVYQQRLETRPIREISLGLHPNGKIYGLGGNSVFTVDPATYVIQTEATFSQTISCGFALTNDALYFGSGAHLIRYRIAK